MIKVGEGKCHACKKPYKDIYEAKKYKKWSDKKRRTHHWEECKVMQVKKELVSSCSGVGPYHGRGFKDIFHTFGLSLRLKHEIANELDRKYVSDKHTYSECQPRYIDTITTAYHSDIMKGILSHEI